MIEKLQKSNQILCTSRKYREVVELAKIRGVNLVFIGKHGGDGRFDKLNASILRTSGLASKIRKFAPNLTVSFCSPEAARISYGLGIKHVAFCDSPHAEAVMRLSLPLVQKLLIPWIIPKKEFSKYGISQRNIVQYKSLDASLIVKNKSKKYSKKDFSLKNKKTIVIRTEESQAAYISTRRDSISIVREIVNKFPDCNIVILGRYIPQINQFKKEFGNKIIILNKVVDGKGLLMLTDVFIGSGGTMTAESALMGISTISYDAVPNIIEQYLVKKHLVKREKDPKKIVWLVKQFLKSDNKKEINDAKKILKSMEDPFPKLVTAIKSI